MLRTAHSDLRLGRATPHGQPRVDRGRRPRNIWRYAQLLPVAPPAEQRLAPGFTPLVAAPRLASAIGVGERFLKLDTANPTHSFKDRVVAVACATALEHGYMTLACSSTGNLANAVAARAAAERIEAAVVVPADLEPENLVATGVYGATIFAVNGTYDDCSRLSVKLSFERNAAIHAASYTPRPRGRPRSLLNGSSLQTHKHCWTQQQQQRMRFARGNSRTQAPLYSSRPTSITGLRPGSRRRR